MFHNRQFYREEEIINLSEKSEIYRQLTEEISVFLESYRREGCLEKELLEYITNILIDVQNNLVRFTKLSVRTQYFGCQNNVNVI
jgi:hypothetical protein